MRDHELEIAQNQKDFNRHATDHLLNSWIQYTPEISPDSFFKSLEIGRDLSVDEITGIGLKIDDYLEKLYADLEVHAPQSDTRALFNSIREIEHHEKDKLTRVANSVYDM